MGDLRTEIREAFESEQAAHPPAPDLRQRVAHRVVTQPGPRSSVQWVAVAVAALLALAVIAGLMSARTAQHRTVPVAPKPTAVADYGPPPAGVPLIYLADKNHPGWYTGFDWSGKPRGTIKLPQAIDPLSNLVQSPDGSFFVVDNGKGGGGGPFYDRLGQPISGPGELSFAIWADDSRHMCGLNADTTGTWWELDTQQPGHTARSIARIAPYSPDQPSGISVVACSFGSDQAVLAKDAYSGPSELWVIQLSSGKQLAHRSLPSRGFPYWSLAASADATLLGENPGPDVIRASDGARVATLDPTYGVVAFSADDQEILVTTSGWTSGFPTHLAVVDLSGRIVWRYDGGEELAGFASNPTGRGFVVGLKTPRDPRFHPPIDVLLVGGDGQVSSLPAGYVRP